MSATVINMDCLLGMQMLGENSVDAIVTDPPYELGFMGKGWDNSGIAYSVELWREALRVLKPGGHLLAFSGSRTYHRMTCAIEDAGFEIRDQIFWLYASGFPKSHNLDNHRGTLTCGCMVSSENDITFKTRRTESASKDSTRIKSSSEHDMRSMQNPNLSQAQRAIKEPDQNMQSPMSESAIGQSTFTHSSEHSETSTVHDGRQKSGMEGRSNDIQKEGELSERPIPTGTRMGKTDGQERRLHNGASASDGALDRPLNDESGSSASYRPQPAEQHADQPRIMANQQRPQDGGAWPICGGCGKPIITQGLGTALKPAHEPICVARKPLIGTVAANVLQFGTGALNIDGCRVEGQDVPEGRSRHGGGTMEGSSFQMPDSESSMPAGRWPANLIHDGSDEVLAAFPDAGGAQAPVRGTEPSSKTDNTFGEFGGRAPSDKRDGGGSAARFFYCAKASKRDRDEGLEDFTPATTSDGRAVAADNAYQRGATARANIHPTVKPTDLMRYLCRLVTPPGGLILDPFTGSGSTGKAAVLEGFAFLGFELSAEYAAIAAARIDNAVTKS